ncbi:DUF3450 domain-containing protein [Echinimonas agarilytica]|uniref:DUF3450 domain-containing protein n=1 Tax=Echinimonas agarilytica TaxID=1215918 RepID=A0AA42B7K5_9GAMM|nr:DUF3450 domain-containing protein [Echinimonas agarilytica]MCM2679822.1 DUF3450 domain-containing protein [Echinimonas agarilytica]
MSKLIKRSLVATALAGAMAMSGTVMSDPLTDVQKASASINTDAAKSQAKIDNVVDQTQVLLDEYRTTLDEIENQEIYNDHVSRLVADQEDSISSLQTQIDGIENTKRGVVPLMYQMIDVLEQFVALDIPINMDERLKRIAKLREVMSQSNVTTSEQYRLVLEAYMVENEYGTKIRAYTGELEYEGTNITVDFFHLGRIAFVAQSLDLKNVWAWDNKDRKWVKLDDEFIRPITTAIRMARKQAPFDLVKLPIQAAENVQ